MTKLEEKVRINNFERDNSSNIMKPEKKIVKTNCTIWFIFQSIFIIDILYWIPNQILNWEITSQHINVNVITEYLLVMYIES